MNMFRNTKWRFQRCRKRWQLLAITTVILLNPISFPSSMICWSQSDNHSGYHTITSITSILHRHYPTCCKFSHNSQLLKHQRGTSNKAMFHLRDVWCHFFVTFWLECLFSGCNTLWGVLCVGPLPSGKLIQRCQKLCCRKISHLHSMRLSISHYISWANLSDYYSTVQNLIKRGICLWMNFLAQKDFFHNSYSKYNWHKTEQYM